MKNTSKVAIAAFLLCTALSGTASAAPEASSFPRIVLVAGPGGEYPPIAYVERGVGADVVGCIRGGGWCEVVADGNRGWVQKSDMDGFFGSRDVNMVVHGTVRDIPVLTFDETAYRSSNYHVRTVTDEAPMTWTSNARRW